MLPDLRELIEQLLIRIEELERRIAELEEIHSEYTAD